MKLLQGGQGSGNFGHSGRPGEIGGSSSSYSEITQEEFYVGWDVFWKPLKSEQEKRFSVYHWQTNSRDIQHYLRRKEILRSGFTKEDLKLDIRNLDELTQSYYLPKNSIVYRGMPHPPDLKMGDTFVDKGYVATSWNIAEAKKFRNQQDSKLIRIFLPEGTPVGYGSETEGELLLGRNKKFRVTDVSNEFIDLEVVE